MKKFVAMAIVALMAAAVPAVADHPDAQHAEGVMLVPSSVAWWVLDGGIGGAIYANTGIAANGLDTYVFALEAGRSGVYTLDCDAGVIGIADLDLEFLDANGGSTGKDGANDHGSAGDGLGGFCGEQGDAIPADTTDVVVINFTGFNVGFDFVVA